MFRLPMLCFLLLSLSYCKKNKETAAPENQGSLQLSEKLCSIEDFIDLAAGQQSSGTASESPPSEAPLGLVASDGQTDGNTEQRRELALSLAPYAQKVQEYQQKHGGLEGQKPENAQLFRLIGSLSANIIENPEFLVEYFASDSLDRDMQATRREVHELLLSSATEKGLILKDKKGKPCQTLAPRNLSQSFNLTDFGMDDINITVETGAYAGLAGVAVLGIGLMVWGYILYKDHDGANSAIYFKERDKLYRAHQRSRESLQDYLSSEKLDPGKIGNFPEFEKNNLPAEVVKIKDDLLLSIKKLEKEIELAKPGSDIEELTIQKIKLENKLEYLKYRRIKIFEQFSEKEQSNSRKEAYKNLVDNFKNTTSLKQISDSDRSANTMKKTSEYLEMSLDQKIEMHMSQEVDLKYEDSAKKAGLRDAKVRAIGGAGVFATSVGSIVAVALSNGNLVLPSHSLAGSENPYHAFLKHFEKITVERVKLGAQAN